MMPELIQRGTESGFVGFEIQCSGYRRPGSSGEAMQECREALEMAQPSGIWKFQSVNLATMEAVLASASREFPNRSKSAGFCLDRQGVVS